MTTKKYLYDHCSTNLSIATSCDDDDSRASTVQERTIFLSENYILNDFDVVCGRGRTCYNHPGNVRFRVIVKHHFQQYLDAPTKSDKTNVLQQIIQYIRQTTPTRGGGFVKKDKTMGRYYEVGDFLAVCYVCVQCSY
jgi:hypothetical protein